MGVIVLVIYLVAFSPDSLKWVTEQLKADATLGGSYDETEVNEESKEPGLEVKEEEKKKKEYFLLWCSFLSLPSFQSLWPLGRLDRDGTDNGYLAKAQYSSEKTTKGCQSHLISFSAPLFDRN